MGSERTSGSQGTWPPPSTSRYRSKACIGAMFQAKSFQDAGAPPICVGFSYRKTAPMPPTDPAAAHGAFKFTCVGYGQRAIEDTAERAGRRLPYCEGLQILVADATQTGRRASGDRLPPSADPVAAAALVRELEALRRRRDDAVLALREAVVRFPDDREVVARLEKQAHEREMALRARVAEARVAARDARERREGTSRSSRHPVDDDALGDGPTNFGRRALGTGTETGGRERPREPTDASSAPSLAEQLRAARGAAPEGSVRRLVEGDKGPGVLFPSAEFEDKFAKSAGKILKNMRRHAGYVIGLVASGPGGDAGKGSSRWG